MKAIDVECATPKLTQPTISNLAIAVQQACILLQA